MDNAASALVFVLITKRFYAVVECILVLVLVYQNNTAWF